MAAPVRRGNARCSSKNGAHLEIVERMELDEVSTELKNQIVQEQSGWMGRAQSGTFSVLSLMTKGAANQLARSCEDYTAWKKL